MKLFYFPVAPNPTKVRLYVAEKVAGGAEWDLTLEVVSLPKGENRTPEFLAKNPLGSLPVLELAEGRCVTESLTIIEYLEELQPQPAMIGGTPERRAEVKSLERYVDGRILGSITGYVHATKSPLALPPNPAVAEYFYPRIESGLTRLDDRLADGRAFLCGDSPTIADCTLAAALGFAQFGEMPLPTDLSHLIRWRTDYVSRSHVNEIV